MNKKVLIIIGVFVAALLVGGGAMAYTNNQNDKKEVENAAMIENEESSDMEEYKMANDGDSMEEDASMSSQGSYVELADYDKDPGKYTDSTKVYFFHASWCPICQSIDEEINADMTTIPSGVTIIKTDFDSSTKLRQKYGVTTQYTFVQVDNNGNETSQWSATSLDKAINGIKS